MNKKNIPPPKKKPVNSRKRISNTKYAQKRRASTPEEKVLIEEKTKLVVAKRNASRAKGNIARVISANEEIKEKVSPNLLDEIKDEMPEALLPETPAQTVVKPHPGPQTEFLAASEDEIFYGGAKGGGKSRALILDPLRYFGNPNFTGILMRRTLGELRELIQETQIIYKIAYPKAVYLKQENVWKFPSGARLYFGYAESVEDAERYRGQSYNWLGLDELPQWPNPDVYNLMKSCVRSTDPTLPTYLRATGNPGNVGAYWVKEMFIDPSPPNVPFSIDVSFTNPINGEVKTSTITRRFIPAKVWDNPSLLHDDSYVATLASLPELQRKQMLEGDWDIMGGTAFPEFSRAVHVIEPFEIPHDWVRFRAADFGFQNPFCVLWFAVDYDGTVYVYREYYGTGVHADEWGRNIAKIERKANEYIAYGVVDGSMAAKRGDIGPSMYEIAQKELSLLGATGFRFADRSPESRKFGKMAVHKALSLREWPDGSMKPGLFVFDTCTNLIRTLPSLPIDPNDPEKVDKKSSEDHAYDALHYGLRSRPMTPQNFNRFDKVTTPYKPLDATFGY
jgi:hypothetical protein